MSCAVYTCISAHRWLFISPDEVGWRARRRSAESESHNSRLPESWFSHHRFRSEFWERSVPVLDIIVCHTVLWKIYGYSLPIHISKLRRNKLVFLILLLIFACIPAHSRALPRITDHAHPLSHVPHALISTGKWQKPMKLLNFYWHESSNTDVSCRQSGRRCGLWQREDYRWSYHPRTWRYRTDTLRSAHEVYLRVHPPPEAVVQSGFADTMWL